MEHYLRGAHVNTLLMKRGHKSAIMLLIIGVAAAIRHFPKAVSNALGERKQCAHVDGQHLT